MEVILFKRRFYDTQVITKNQIFPQDLFNLDKFKHAPPNLSCY